MGQNPQTPNVPTDALLPVTVIDEDGVRLNIGDNANRAVRVVIVGGSPGGGPVIQVNGTNTSNQALLDFVDTASVTWANPSGGIVEATSTGGASGVTDVNKVGCRAYSSTTITATGTSTAIPFDSERWDNGGTHSTSSNTSRFVATTAGVYSLVFNYRSSAFSTSGGPLDFYIEINGTGTVISARRESGTSTSDIMMGSVNATYDLALNDYLEVFVFGGSSITLDATNQNYGCEATFQLIAPD